jgi:hypothetical protein
MILSQTAIYALEAVTHRAEVMQPSDDVAPGSGPTP